MKDGLKKTCISKAHERFRLEMKLFKLNCLNPKGSELLLSRMKPPETVVEVRIRSDAQIDGMT
jgi:hypothetical protein